VGYAILKLFIKEEEYKCNFGIIIILSSPSLSPPIPSLSGICNRKEILLNLSMKCSNLAYNAQGSRATIVVVGVGAVKIHVAALEGKILNSSGKWKDRRKFSIPPKLV